MGNRKQPFGYKMEFGEIVPQPQEAETVRSIYLQYLAGASFKQLAERLQTEDVPYDGDKPWNKNMVARILEDDRYIGEKHFPALIPTEQFHAAQERRKEMRPEYKQTPAQKELRRLCGGIVPDSVARKVLKILNQVVDDPQLIKIESSGVPTTEDIRQRRLELDKLLQTPPVDEEIARQKAMELAVLTLVSVEMEEYEAHRLRSIFGKQTKLRDLDANLEVKEEWYFSIVDVVAVLTDSPNPQTYWRVLKKRLKDEGNETVTSCNALKMTAADGKRRLTDVADTEQLLRIIQSIPSPKAEPFKLWLAQVGRERIEETIDPELTIDRALETYLKKGYTREWINQRLQAIQVRKELTDEWDARGVQKGVEYAILTDEISRAWSGMSTRQYKNLKGLKKENLRDNMTTLELVLNMLAEATTTQFSKDRKPTTFQENLEVAKAGGQVAGRTRKDIESQSNTPVISSKNAAQINQVITDLLKDATSNMPKKEDDK